MREVVFDTETTGLSAANGDRLVEIGCVELVNRVETGRVFHVYINPERDMPPEAEAVHGLSSAFLKDKPVFEAIAEDILDIADMMVIGLYDEPSYLPAQAVATGFAATWESLSTTGAPVRPFSRR